MLLTAVGHRALFSYLHTWIVSLARLSIIISNNNKIGRKTKERFQYKGIMSLHNTMWIDALIYIQVQRAYWGGGSSESNCVNLFDFRRFLTFYAFLLFC